MRLPDFQYKEPRSIEEACLFLGDYGRESRILAGGTDLLPLMKQKIFRPKYLVNLSRIPNLDRIEFNDQSGLQIGALTKVRSLETNPAVLEWYPIIGQAAGTVGSVQLRQMGTVGGNLSLDTRCYYYNQSDFWRNCRPTCIKMGGERCNAIGGGKRCFAVFSGDLAPTLVALGAKIKLVSTKGERAILLDDYYTGDGARPLAIEPEEILIGVEVPPIRKGVGGIYLKYRVRRSIDFPLASAAITLILNKRERVCREVKVVIGAVSSKPQVVEEIIQLLKGKKIEDPIIEEASTLAFRAANPVANIGSSAPYRKRMIKVFVERGLRQILAESCMSLK